MTWSYLVRQLRVIHWKSSTKESSIKLFSKRLSIKNYTLRSYLSSCPPKSHLWKVILQKPSIKSHLPRRCLSSRLSFFWQRIALRLSIQGTQWLQVFWRVLTFFLFRTVIHGVLFLVTVKISDITHVIKRSVRRNVINIDSGCWGSPTRVFLSLFLTILLFLFFASLFSKGFAAIWSRRVKRCFTLGLIDVSLIQRFVTKFPTRLWLWQGYVTRIISFGTIIIHVVTIIGWL